MFRKFLKLKAKLTSFSSHSIMADKFETKKNQAFRICPFSL